MINLPRKIPDAKNRVDDQKVVSFNNDVLYVAINSPLDAMLKECGFGKNEPPTVAPPFFTEPLKLSLKRLGGGRDQATRVVEEGRREGEALIKDYQFLGINPKVLWRTILY